MAEKKMKKVCKCENCGNEAEMMVTCSLEEVQEAEAQAKAEPAAEAPKVQGQAVCTHCGNEADMWIDV